MQMKSQRNMNLSVMRRVPLIDVPDFKKILNPKKVSLKEYFSGHVRVWVAVLIGWCSFASISGVLSSDGNNYALLWALLGLSALGAEVWRAKKTFGVPACADKLNFHLLKYNSAVRVWNEGLKYALEEFVATRERERLIQKYWKFGEAKSRLLAAVDKGLQQKLSARDLAELKVYLDDFIKDYQL